MCIHGLNSIFQIMLIFYFLLFSFIFYFTCIFKDINKHIALINIFTKLSLFESEHLCKIYTFKLKWNAKAVLCNNVPLKIYLLLAKTWVNLGKYVA